MSEFAETPDVRPPVRPQRHPLLPPATSERGDSPTSPIAEMVRQGLTAPRKHLPPVLFYDKVGSALFERICVQPEYYLTRTERRILERDADQIARALPEAITLIELGCGSAEKTEILLRALLDGDHLVRYVPCDVSAAALQRASTRLRRNLPALEVRPLLGDFATARRSVPDLVRGATVWAFLGSSIGNFEPDAAVGFLRDLRATLPGQLLLGADKVKNPAILSAAYDDAAGVTAAFNRNVLVRINRELGANFVPAGFQHAAHYDVERQRIEMHLVSTSAQQVTIRALDLRVQFAAGESIHTENSYKYGDEDLELMTAAAGYRIASMHTDANGWFALVHGTPTVELVAP